MCRKRHLIFLSLFPGKGTDKMVYFVGAGCGAPDLITVRGQRLLCQADCVIYAGSLVNPKLLEDTKPECKIYNSALMTLEEVFSVMKQSEQNGEMTVRLHTGDPSLYGAIREQMDLLDQEKIPYEVVPGVSSFCGAAAALGVEYTLPDVSQTVIISRMAGRTPVPPKEKISLLASHQATMVLFLSVGMAEEVEQELLKGGYPADTPAAVVYKASWPDEKILRCTVGTLSKTVEDSQITKTALIVVGGCLGETYERSKLYDPAFEHEFRKSTKE
jgi:precorrin-4/cobalt-precorrin-4 C11-methyltransferase